jgi:hypothetical protein
MKFSTTLIGAKKTATGIEIPDEVIENLGAGKKPPVKVTVNGYEYRTTVASRGDRFLIPVSAKHREAAGLTAGDPIEVSLALDTEPRVIEVPEDLAAELERDKKAGAFYKTLSYSQQRGYVEPITDAKKPETRERRVAKAVSMLREGRKR